MQPFVRPERIRAEIADHATVGGGRGAVAPGRHPVHDQSVREKGLARARVNFHTPALVEGTLARGVIGVGNVLVVLVLRIDTGKAFEELATDDFLRAFPHHERRSARVELDHRDAEDETVVLAQEAALPLALAQQTVDVGGIALATKACARLRLPRHRQWIPRVTNRDLRPIPVETVEAEFSSDEINGLTPQRATVVDCSIDTVVERIDTGEPGILVTQPLLLSRVLQCFPSGCQRSVNPVEQNSIMLEFTPAKREEIVNVIAHSKVDAIMPR